MLTGYGNKHMTGLHAKARGGPSYDNDCSQGSHVEVEIWRQQGKEVAN